MTPEEADVAAAQRLWLEIERCTDSDDERALIAAALATTRRDAFAAGVEASAGVAEALPRVADWTALSRDAIAAAIRALVPEEPRDG